MLEAYLNQSEPLTVSTPKGVIVIKNMNMMTFKELHESVEAATKTHRDTELIKLLVLKDDEGILRTLTRSQSRKIIKQWEESSGVNLATLVQVFYIVEKYPSQLQADLGEFTNIKTVTELLSLPALDIATITSGLLQETGRKSYIVAKCMNVIQPWSAENNSELLLLTAVNILRSFGKNEPIKLNDLQSKITDNKEDDTPQTITAPDPETEERIKAWRETGKLTP